jgi:hypothetical protein
MKSPPDGIKLIVDRETGLPSNLSEIMVRANLISALMYLSVHRLILIPFFL